MQYGRQIELKKKPGFDIQKAMRSVCSQLNDTSAPVLCESDADPLVGDLDPTQLTDALNWISTGALKFCGNGDEAHSMTVSIKKDLENPSQARIEWSGLTQVDHDPFRSFAGSDEIRMSLASKIVEEHGGSARYEDGRFVVTLPLTD